jgi:hypothetical protein
MLDPCDQSSTFDEKIAAEGLIDVLAHEVIARAADRVCERDVAITPDARRDDVFV